MKIIISNDSSTPLYEQIKDGIKNEIIKGNMEEGEKLPSVRSLSRDLKVSILTVKKAYDELVDEGFIETRQGLGSFVKEGNSNLRHEELIKNLEEKTVEIINMAKSIKMPIEELQGLIEYIYRGDLDD